MKIVSLVIIAVIAGCVLASPGHLRWQNVPTVNAGPTNNGAFSFTSLESANSMYVFGGVFENFPGFQNIWSAKLWTLNMSNKQWTLLDDASGPVARGLHAGVTDPVRNQLFVFGGINYTAFFNPITIFGDLWSWDYVNGGWSELTSTPGPGALADLSMVYHGDALYVFGGTFQVGFNFVDSNALWRYDIAGDSWTQISANGNPNAPSPRHNARMAALDNRLYINSGSVTAADIEQDDSWSYNLVTGVWSDITPNDNHNIDPGRTFPGHDAMDDIWLIYGGEIPGGEEGCGSFFPQNTIGDTWVGQIKNNNKLKWKKASPSSSPPALKRSQITHLTGKFNLLGGFTWICSNNTGPGPVYNDLLWTLVGL